MSTVIGPISRAEWVTMRQYRVSLRRMRTSNPETYKECIRKEQKLLDGMLSSLYKEAA